METVSDIAAIVGLVRDVVLLVLLTVALVALIIVSQQGPSDSDYDQVNSRYVAGDRHDGFRESGRARSLQHGDGSTTRRGSGVRSRHVQKAKKDKDD